MSYIDDDQVFLALSDEQLIALTGYGEAAGDTPDGSGVMGVINVIANRVTDPQDYADQSIYNLTSSVWKAVILKPSQFSCYNVGDPVRAKLITIAQNWNYYFNSDYVLNQAYQLAVMATAGTLEDNTSGATNYYALSILPPSWTNEMRYIGQIGTQAFYSAFPSGWSRGIAAVVNTVSSAATTVASSPMTWVLLAGVGFLAYEIYSKRKSQ